MAPRDRLAAQRRARGLTQEALAQALGVAVSSVRHWERGTSTPLARHRPRLAEQLNVSLAELEIMLNGVRAPDGHEVPEWLDHFAALEQGAAEIRAFESFVVHGLLQTREYAAAIERADIAERSDEDVTRRVEARMARQGVLDHDPNPVRLTVILDESVLYRVAGSREVMAAQLDHLAHMAERPNIGLRVLPLDCGVFSAGFGSFTLFCSRRGVEPFMACVMDRVGPHYLDRSRLSDVEAHAALFDRLCDVALSPSESINLIRHVAKEHYR